MTSSPPPSTPPPTSLPRRVVVFNDSPTVRAAIRLAIESDPGFSVVSEAHDARKAATLVAKSAADVVVMDIVMPGVDGYEATRAIMEKHPTPILMVSSVLDPRDHEVIFRALGAGALYVSPPPPAPGGVDYKVRRDTFLQLLRSVAGARPRMLSDDSMKSNPVPRAASTSFAIDAIGIVASAGGPQALLPLLRASAQRSLPPILLVQHLAPGFAESFASWLAHETGYVVRTARQGEPALADTVYLAPDDHHLGLGPANRLIVSRDPPIRRFRPSGNFLLASLAERGARALGVVLTGMGDDGAEGALKLHRAGGYVIVQDAGSSAIWGMPKAAEKAGAADIVLPLSEIAAHLAKRSQLA